MQEAGVSFSNVPSEIGPGGQTNTPETDFWINGNTYNDTKANAGTTYYYIVKPVYGDKGIGSASNEVSAAALAGSGTLALTINNPNMQANGVQKEIDPDAGTQPTIKDGSFSGKYRFDDSEDWEGWYDWTGVRASDSFGTTGTAWGGVWSTDFGLMVLKQDGSNITGVYNGIPLYQIEGTVSKFTFKGKFDEGWSEGEFQFILSMDGKSFEGKLRYYDEDEWGYWNGIKKK